jgi:hypothetical protein
LRIVPFVSSPKQGGKRWGERFLEENITFLREKSIIRAEGSRVQEKL